MKYITNSGVYEYDTILLDLNGTLTVYGQIDPNVPELINQLKKL
jgi:hydroxymethylpyrimidine pyrophosphatase-like HAD family hydrolase